MQKLGYTQVIQLSRRVLVVEGSDRLAVCALGLVLALAFLMPPDSAQGLQEPTWAGGAGLTQLVQQENPVERRLQVGVRDAYRNMRRSLKKSWYIVFNSPTWWWRRVKRLVWPLTFAIGALLVDASLLAAWKSDGLRILTTYVPLMLYVYSRLFFSSRTSIVTRLAVVLSLVYGVWRRDFIADRSWYTLGIGRVDDFFLIVGAIRAFVLSCPQDLIRNFAERAVEIRSRVGRERPRPVL